MGNACLRNAVYSPSVSLESFHSSKMKKSASVSHSRTSLCKSLSHDGAPVSTANDDCAINELLEGLMDLNVYLPDGRRVRMTVERRTPMMDLLVQVTTANKITPGDHVIQVLTDSGKEILYRPNTPIGVLDTHVIFIASKSSVTEPAVKKLHKMPVQPFEQTFRLQVKLPRNQLTVLRVSPKMTLTEVKDKICSDKNLDANDYHLVRPSQPNIFLDLNTSLASYGSTEISLLSKQSIKANIHSSVADLLNYSRREEDGKEKGIPGLLTKTQSQSSLVSSSSENVSSRKDPQNFGNYQIDQVRTALTIKPKLRKRPAPPPPTQKTKNSVEEVDKLRLSSQIRNGDKFLHSRRSSDSSGYHEASVVSEIQENGFQDPSVAKRNSHCESNVIPVQLFPQKEIHTTEKTCMSSKNVECQSTISNSGSISSTSSMLTVSKKRKAPPPPAPKRCISKPQLEPVREVIASNKITDGESKSLLHVNQETLESEFTGLVDIVEANLSLDQEEVLSSDPVTVSVPSKDSDDLSSIQPNPPREFADGSNERTIENSQNTSEVELLTVQDTPEPRVHGSELVIESVFSKESDDLSSIQPNPPHECANGSNERTIEDSQNTSEVGSTSSREQIMTDGQHQRQNSLSSINTLDDIENTFRQTIAEGERALKWEQEKEECRSFLPTGIANGTSNKTFNAQFDSDLTHNGHLSHIDTDFSAVEQQVNDMTINEPLSSSNCLPEEPLSFKGRNNGVNSHLQQNEDKKKSSSEVCIKTNGLTSHDDGMSVNTEEEVVNVKLKRGTSLTNFIITSYKNGEANIYRPNSRIQTELLLRSDNVCHLSNESLSAAQKPSEYKKENLETKPSSQMFVKEQNENPPKFQNLNVNGEEDQIEVTSKAPAACIKEAYVQDFRGHVRLKCAQFNDLKCLPLVGRSTSMLNLVNHRQSFLQKKMHDGVLETLRRVQSQHSVSNKSCDPEFSDEDQELQEKYKQPKKNFLGGSRKWLRIRKFSKMEK
ncbi:cordon-bleu protein-like 1 isoform X3 [Limulus polyphemus]|uniref:Cordon-bleu protein-like 1 isoform X3 n=1 Tax=Limulus polyphemus TaxID=6850 RepID=A0ABM1THN4_LIMPO|nr:cordon-bleu protein-like 1 isoform X3 [Limulus polyphemus]